MPSLCACPSVCVCVFVCLSHSGIVSQEALLSQRDSATRLSVEILQLQNIAIMCMILRLAVFTARGYAKRGICRRRVSVSVCVSVTLRYCTKTAKRRITQIMPHDRPGTLVFKRDVS